MTPQQRHVWPWRRFDNPERYVAVMSDFKVDPFDPWNRALDEGHMAVDREDSVRYWEGFESSPEGNLVQLIIFNDSYHPLESIYNAWSQVGGTGGGQESLGLARVIEGGRFKIEWDADLEGFALTFQGDDGSPELELGVWKDEIDAKEIAEIQFLRGRLDRLSSKITPRRLK